MRCIASLLRPPLPEVLSANTLTLWFTTRKAHTPRPLTPPCNTLALWPPRFRPAAAVPFAAIESLWEAFNDVADGFGITLFEFQEICAELAGELGVNRVKMDDKSEALFKVLDNDSVSFV